MGQEQDALARWVLSTRAGDHIDSVQHPPPYCTPLLLLIATVHSNHTRLGHFFEMRVYVCVCCFRCCLPTPRRYGALQSPASVSFEMHFVLSAGYAPPRPGRPPAGERSCSAPPWTGERARVLSTLFRPTTPRRIRYPGSCARGHSASRHLQGRAAKQHPLASRGTVSASAFLLAGNWARRPTRPSIGSRSHLVTRYSERLNAR